MKTTFGTFHRTRDGSFVRNVADDQLGAGRYVVAFAGRKIVENANLVAARQQRFGQVRTNETGTAGDQIEMAERRRLGDGFIEIGNRSFEQTRLVTKKRSRPRPQRCGRGLVSVRGRRM